MLNQSGIDYILAQLKNGISEDEIRNALASAGWIEADVTDNLTKAKEFFASAGGIPVPLPSHSHNLHLSKKAVVIGIACLLIFGSIAVAGYFAIPPTPEKVMRQAAAKFFEVKSMDFSGNFVLDVSVPAGLFSIDTLIRGFPLANANDPNSKIAGNTTTKVELGFSGSVDVTDVDHTKSQVSLDASYSVFSFGLELRLLDPTLYIKFNKLPNMRGYDFTQYSDKWIKIEKKDISDLYGVEIKAEKKKPELTEGQKKQIRELAEKSNFFKSITKLPDDKIEERAMYHYALDLNMQAIKDYLLEVERIENSTATTGEDLDNMAFSNVEVWVGKSDKMVYKLMAQMSAKPEIGTTAQSSVNLNAALNFKNFNHPTPVYAPPDFQSFKDIIANLQNDAISKANDAKRLSDIRMMMTALELFYNDNNRYPKSENGHPSTTDGKPTFYSYISLGSLVVPKPPGGSCTEAQNAYTYTQVGNSSYTLTFCLGQTFGGYTSGVHTAGPSGIQ